MKLNIQPLGQRDDRWKNQRLGTVNGTTIGSDGCVTTSASMLYTYHGKAVLPNFLDDYLTANKLYYNGNLWIPANVNRFFNEVTFIKIINCSAIPAPISEIKSSLDQKKPVFVWVMNNGVKHCTLAVGYDGDEIIVNDPWMGDTVNIKNRWGLSALKIIEVDFYNGNAKGDMQLNGNALTECLRQHSILVGENEQLKKDLNQTKEDKEKMSIVINQKDSEINNLKEEIKSLNNQNNSQKELIETLRKEKIDLLADSQSNCQMLLKEKDDKCAKTIADYKSKYKMTTKGLLLEILAKLNG